MICILKVSHSLLSHVRDHISAIWHGDVLACATLFHCPHHTVSYYFPHSVCTFFFFLRKRLSSAQSDSPLACRLTFPVKELYCWFSVPLAPSIKQCYQLLSLSTSTSHRDTDWPGPSATRPSSQLSHQAVRPTQCFLLIPYRLPLKLLGYCRSCSMRTLIIAAPPPRKCTNNWLCIYFPGEAGGADWWSQHSPSHTFVMNGPHSIFLHFPLDTTINVDRWYVLSIMQWSWAHCLEKFGSYSHLLPLAFSPSSLFLLLSLSLHLETCC